MFVISVAQDFDRFARTLHDLRLKQLPYAAARALNDTAQLARSEITGAMQTIFDRPIGFTVNSIAVLSANKTSLAATVLVKDQQAKYLTLEETGGTRTAAMNTRKPGAALTVPGVGTKLDAHGNIPSGLQARLKKAAERDRASRATTPGKKGKGPSRDSGIFYARGQGPHNRGPGGYFQRLPGHKLVRLTGYEATETYQPRFHFRDRVTKVARDNFRVFLMRRLREATAQ